METRETREFRVPGISCGHCEMAINQSVRRLRGIDHVKVDLKQKLVTVSYDGGAVKDADIRTAIEDAGYEVV